MKLLAVVFDYPGKDRYERLTAAWEASAKANCPGADVVVRRIDPPTSLKRNFGLSSNNHKFKVWADFIGEQRAGEHVVLMDSDTVILHDLRPAFRESFDIGLTTRTSTSWKYNGGVVFVKVNERSLRFIEKWREIDQRMYEDDAFHNPYRNKYRGQNQASLGYCVENNDTGAVLKEFPCAIWNAANDDWMRCDENTKVIHVKSGLRRYCLGETAGMPSKLKFACTEWRKYETMAKETEGTK